MPRDIVVIAGSAGALQPLSSILGALPASFPASIFVVIHTSPETPGMLPSVLRRRVALPIDYADDGASIEPGHVYIAPPDRHLLLENRHLEVTRGPRENGFRPAADPLFRTAALHYGARVIGIILSGGLSDGIHGLATIKARGGIAVVQQVEEASATSMPKNAIRNVDVDHVVPAAVIPALLMRLVNESAAAEPATAASASAHEEPDRAERGTQGLRDQTMPGPASGFTCPECGGALWETADRTLTRFTCHVGHAYNADALASGMAEKLEQALWTALRVLEENGAFLRRMQERTSNQGLSTIAESFESKADDVEARAEILRSVLVDRTPEGAGAAPLPPELQSSDVTARLQR